MRTLVTGKQMKAVDAHAIVTVGIPSMVLMERAAFAVAQRSGPYAAPGTTGPTVSPRRGCCF